MKTVFDKMSIRHRLHIAFVSEYTDTHEKIPDILKYWTDCTQWADRMTDIAMSEIEQWVFNEEPKEEKPLV
jgi:hypothetical protein